MSLRDDFARIADDAVPVFTFSAGVDEYRMGEPMEHLMLRADTALYAAKAQGRDRVVCADQVPAELRQASVAAAEYADSASIRSTLRVDD